MISDQNNKLKNTFQRSINISSDLGNLGLLENFVITKTGIDMFTRILSGFQENTNQAAWSITGPYGAGKSVNLLFLMQSLGNKEAFRFRKMIENEAPDLFSEIRKSISFQDEFVLFIPVIGSKEPIVISIIKAIKLIIESLGMVSVQKHLELIEDQINAYGVLGEINESIFISQLDSFINDVLKDTTYSKVVIVLDELGKSLEFAAQNYEFNDIGILQTLAEFANRSKGQFSLITVLHQAFDRYAQSMSLVQQHEWSKIQGRFEDIAFLETAGELLKLLSKAIEQNLSSPKTNPGIILGPAVKIGMFSGELSDNAVAEYLSLCLPLHPIVTLLLIRMFRNKFAQNERSLFAFVSSKEPNGFQDFLHKNNLDSDSEKIFGLSELYDYLQDSYGGSLFTQKEGYKWAEVMEALDRLPAASEKLDIELIKAIGLLEIFGDQNRLKASVEILAYCLSESSEKIRERIENLEAQKILVYRVFKDAYGFWQGSDVDLHEEYKIAKSKLDMSVDLANRIQALRPIKPILAKRHLYETGTLRFLKPIIVQIDNVESLTLDQFDNPGGGILLIIIPNQVNGDETKQDQFTKVLETIPKQFSAQVVIMVPGNIEGIQEAIVEVAAWDFVRNNVIDLESDRIARKELSANEIAANARFQESIRNSFDLSSAHKISKWFFAGKEMKFDSSREFTSKLSDMFDELYCSAPIIPNELINRNNLSTAGAAGRNALLDRIINFSHEENFGIDGFPPEMSMYLSIVKQSGLHFSINGKWQLGVNPKADSDPMNIRPLWDGIWSWLNENWSTPAELTTLYDYLKQPPYGIKEGLLPVYCVIAFLQWQSQIAIYEEDAYVPELSTAVVERLVKVPERFKIQFYPFDETRSKLLHEYTRIFRPEVDPARIGIIMAVHPIMEFVHKLPNYSKSTSAISKNTKDLREAIFIAKNPQQLLLTSIPKAFGYNFAENDDETEVIPIFFEKLRKSLLELETAYNSLINMIRSELCQFLLLPDQLDEARDEISSRAELLVNWIEELTLKSFILRLKDKRLPDREWLESVAAGITNVPPKNWNDQDVSLYRLKVREYAKKFRNTEELILHENSHKMSYNREDLKFRLGIMDQTGREISKILSISQNDQKEVHALEEVLQDTIKEKSDNTDQIIYTLGHLLRKLIEDNSE